MRRQLLHLLELIDLPNVFIQVLPTGRICGAALRGPFVLMETPEHKLWVWVDGQKTTAAYSDADRVSFFTQTHGMIRMNTLSTADSAEFITKLAEEL